MIIKSTIRSDAPAPRRARKLEESQVVRAPTMMLAAGIPKQLARKEGLPTPPIADTDPIAVLASDLRRSLDPVTLSILEGLPRTVIAEIDPRLGHAYDGRAPVGSQTGATLMLPFERSVGGRSLPSKIDVARIGLGAIPRPPLSPP